MRTLPATVAESKTKLTDMTFPLSGACSFDPEFCLLNVSDTSPVSTSDGLNE